ncbi:hypothetical protein [Clostridium sp. Marseille-P299]|uniref:hypothetical protein n=1 Tax=Clostridium sp. Marseille-P299 TaxID=1805477 RepID=UPI0008342C05|nr:hypothetical protein [Clostridium sp. Marseille-P299]
MSISIGSDSLYTSTLASSGKSSKTSQLENTLNKDLSNATDEELLESCKSFETYLVEQVVKQVKKSMVSSEEDENTYLTYFGDTLYEEVAEQITESGQLGIANQLFEAMKRNQ